MAISLHTNPLATIPQPPTKPLLGNLPTMNPGAPVQGLMRLAREYGSIYRLAFPGRELVVVSGFDLVDELCDEKRFDKKVWRPLRNVRAFAGDALFTAQTQEPNWHKAHNILLPNFSQRAMQGYFPAMLDIARQMMDKWERLNADDEIDVPGDMTRLTLDTIGLCGFDYRFNSFYRQDMHPFVQSMVRALGEAMDQSQRLPLQEKLMLHKHRQYRADIDFMNGVVDHVIQERKASGAVTGKQDLLSYMLTGVDKQSGEGLDDLNIRYQIITFLIAGHETTSGLLSFALYNLLQHPEALARAYAEVDRVLGPDPQIAPTFAQINRLQYVGQILKESLRLWPTAPLFAVYPYAETMIGGKYTVDSSREWAVLIPMLHRDRSVWGEDAEKFNPEHFSREAEASRPANAYKPFGNGQRACIGRQFAMQEATLVLGMLLQRFKLLDHTNYQLKVKETLTLKPDDFKIKVRRRETADYADLAPVNVAALAPAASPAPLPASVPQHHTPLLVLYGSNLGSAEDLAQRIAQDGTMRGFSTSVASLDEYVDRLPREGAVVLVSASYNGTPPDNAAAFCAWLQDPQIAPDALRGVNYAVFGCGNREWAATYQAIPKLLDNALEQHGARRLYTRGEGDASDDFDGQFQAWYAPLWQELAEELEIDLGTPDQASQAPLLEIEVIAGTQPANPFVAAYGAVAMQVLANRELHTKDGPSPSERSTRHIALALPAGVEYRAGDHLGVIPRNGEAQVKRVAAHFDFDPAARIRLHKSDGRKTSLPVDEPILLADLLANYVELQDVASRSQLRAMVEHTECPPDKKKLQALCGDDEASAARYRAEVLMPRKSLLDLLKEFPSCTMPFNVYLELLAPLRPRYYSISSSPLQRDGECSITVSVVSAPAKSGHGEYRGVCSSYVADLNPGETVYAFVRDTKSAFRLSTDARTPLLMVGPGTGLAPFRGFLQERAALQARGEEVGSSLLFFGCRHAQQDFIYERELRAFEAQGLTRLQVAFSREHKERKVYVQDMIREHKEEVWQFIQQGATIYICGDASKMAPDVRRALAGIYREQQGVSSLEAEQWLSEMGAQGRYLVDVWGN